jgi:glucosamine--fructose-6-phosphate aminotransferase (isomerizing)
VGLARYHAWLACQPDGLSAAAARLDDLNTILGAVIDDLTRPIDTIRHQAKTVTVGISRPQQDLSPLILEALTELDVPVSHIADRDREMLEILSPLITTVSGAVLYDVVGRGEDPDMPQWDIQAVRACGRSTVAASRYRVAQNADGSKRRALRTGRVVTASGPHGSENLVVMPVLAPSGNAIAGLILVHLEVTPKASLQQKVAVLKAIDHKYDEVSETLAETRPGVTLDRVLGDADPRTLVFASVHDILARPSAE